MGGAKEKAGKSLKNFRFIISTIWKVSPSYFITLITITLILSLLPLVPMVIVKRIIDLLVYGEKNDMLFHRIMIYVGLMTTAYLAMSLMQSLKELITDLTVNRVAKSIIYSVQKKAVELDLRFFDTPAFYKKLENTRRVIGRSWDFLLTAPITIVGEFISLVIMIGIIASCNIWLAPVIVAGSIPYIIAQFKIRKREMAFYTEEIPETRKINYMEELLSERRFAKEVRIFNLHDFVIDRAKGLFNTQFGKIKQMRLWSLRFNSIWGVFSESVMFLCQVFISIRAFRGSISVGNWQFYIQTLQSIRGNLQIIFETAAISYTEDLYADILHDFLNTPPQIDPDEGIEFPSSSHPPHLEFRNVNFAYAGTTTTILKNVSFTIHPGEKIALVGTNGSGKSTLIKLLMRLYEPVVGGIFFDGVDIRTYRVGSIYNLFCVVFQDFARYGFTLKENIGIGDLEKINDEMAIGNAMNLSGLDTVVGKLEKGYDTHLSKEYDINGCSDISVGEWQKVAIARGLLRDAPIAILDEPTASLDPEAEYKIYNNFIRFCENRTAILISHRLSSVRKVDRIFFVRNGRIAEAGSHSELMLLNGHYARLFSLQADTYKIPA